MMASFRALCLAGVASLVVTAGAHAADLLPPPPPVEAPEYAPAPVSFGGGWYLRGDVGIGNTKISNTNSTFAPGVTIPDFRYDQADLGDSGFIDAGVGYRFNEYFRADITGEYRASARYNTSESYSCAPFCPNGFGPRLADVYASTVQSSVGLVNGYVDLGTWYSATPFLGAGVGIARVGVLNGVDNGQSGGFGLATNKYQTNFAFALMAGLDFAVTQNLKMEIGYRYLDMGNVSSGTYACTSGNACEAQHFHFASNDIRLGFRYALADFGPVPVQQIPLIRKY